MKAFLSALGLVGLAGVFLFSQSGCASRRTPNVNWPVAEPAISGLEKVWSVSLGSNRLARAVASDPVKAVIYAIVSDFEKRQWKLCVQISADGKLEREFTYKKYATMLRTAQLRRGESRDLLTYCVWACPTVAADTNGKTLWKHDKFWGGLDDLWVADLNGDGLDEVIIGHNGFSGVYVLRGNGKKLWRNKQGANIWSVCAADLDGDGKPEVITTSARGKVRVFKGDGKRLPDLEPPPGYYANMVRPLKLSDSDRAEGILVTGGKGRIAALKGDGTLAWEASLGTPAAGGIAEPAPGKSWLALASRSLVILDTRNGSTIAEVKPAAEYQLCWLEVKGQTSPLLIVSSHQRIYAYRLKE